MLILIDTNDLEAIMQDADKRKSVVDELQQLGRVIPEMPTALRIRKLQQQLEQTRTDVARKALTPQLNAIVDKDPAVQALHKELEALGVKP